MTGDWWMDVPRARWRDTYEAEYPRLVARTPKSIAVFQAVGDAAYHRSPEPIVRRRETDEEQS